MGERLPGGGGVLDSETIQEGIGMNNDDNKGDIVDQANAISEVYTRAAVSTRKPEGPKATGYCLWCEDPVESPRRWCDADCRDQWEKHPHLRTPVVDPLADDDEDE